MGDDREQSWEGRRIRSREPFQAGIERKHTESLSAQSPFALIARVSSQDHVEQTGKVRLGIQIRPPSPAEAAAGSLRSG